MWKTWSQCVTHYSPDVSGSTEMTHAPSSDNDDAVVAASADGDATRCVESRVELRVVTCVTMLARRSRRDGGDDRKWRGGGEGGADRACQRVGDDRGRRGGRGERVRRFRRLGRKLERTVAVRPRRSLHTAKNF